MSESQNDPLATSDRDIASLLAPQDRRQHLPGFDAVYADFPDYILRCTHRIWEQKNVGLIHTINGDVQGMESVVANTLATMVGVPDRTLYGEDVIWSGDAATGFFSSHRILSQMTNLGCSEFGNPTGRRATVRTIADCEVRQNRIGREWLVRDNLALVWQLGLNPHTVARVQAQADADAGTRWARWVDVARRVLEGARLEVQVPEEVVHHHSRKQPVLRAGPRRSQQVVAAITVMRPQFRDLQPRTLRGRRLRKETGPLK